MRFPKNPNFAQALGIESVEPDKAFIAYQGGKVVLRGVFLRKSEYLEDGWVPIQAVDESGAAVNVDPYEVGIVPRSNGVWQEDACVLEATKIG